MMIYVWAMTKDDTWWDVMDVYYIYTGYKHVPLPTQVVSKISSFPQKMGLWKWGPNWPSYLWENQQSHCTTNDIFPMRSSTRNEWWENRGKPAARPNQFDGTNHGFRLVAPPANQSMFKWANIFILLRLLLRGRRSQKLDYSNPHEKPSWLHDSTSINHHFWILAPFCCFNSMFDDFEV